MNEQSLTHYLTELGREGGTPGGGSAAAYIGAMSVSLARLTADIQKDKKVYASYRPDLYDLLEQTEVAREEFVRLAKKDGEAFEPVLAAYKLPKKTEEEREARKKAIEVALLGAVNPPLSMLGVSMQVLTMLEKLTEMQMKGTIVNDLLVAALFMRTVLETAVLNVSINTKLMENQAKKEEIEQRADQMVLEGKRRVDRLTASLHYFIRHDTWPEPLLEEE